MNLLVDTHILIWYIAGNSSLNPKMTDLLEATENNLFISVASLWEIAIKVGKRKLDLGIKFHELEEILDRLNIQILPILFGDLNVQRTLPFHHTDPFDRIAYRR
jgi:PIN domain nuclease of toxin-antitoxin system